jgi:hypothetical protein
MTNWVTLPGESWVMYSPIGLVLVDEFTTRAPIGAVRPALAIDDGAGSFRATGIDGVITPSATLIYPGLERRHDATGAARKYRITVDADFYLPRYQLTPTIGTPQGIVFDAYPYNDTTAPAQPPTYATLALLPGPSYPFESIYPVVRGIVKDGAGAAVAGALVTLGATERVMTDARGAFSIALRWVSMIAQITAQDDAGHVGQISVDVTDPNSRDVSQTITIH